MPTSRGDTTTEVKPLPEELILASASPRRRELLRLLGLPFRVVITETDEQRQPGESPDEYACRLSREKARAALARAGTSALILAADTIVVDGDDVLQKPRDADEARAILRRLRGRTHHVYTAVTLLGSRRSEPHSVLVKSPVTMRSYTDAEIEAYIATGDPFDKAGAYAIQHDGFNPVQEMTHCFASVMGLPLCHVVRMLRESGVIPRRNVPEACQAHLGYACPVYRSILAGKE